MEKLLLDIHNIEEIKVKGYMPSDVFKLTSQFLHLHKLDIQISPGFKEAVIQQCPVMQVIITHFRKGLYITKLSAIYMAEDFNIIMFFNTFYLIYVVYLPIKRFPTGKNIKTATMAHCMSEHLELI